MNEHAHSHHHSAGHGGAFIAGIALNGLFVLAEIIYGIRADSLALLADAGHNAGDVLGLFMAWGAVLLARRAPSADFTYGLQSASIIAALANALLLMVIVGGIGWEAIQRLTAPVAPEAHTIIAVAAIGIFVNGATAWLLRGHGHDLNIHSMFLHMAGDAAVSLGVVLAGIITLITGWLWPDPLVSLLVVVVIIAGTWRLLIDSVRLALHAVPRHIEPTEVRQWLAAQPGVNEVHDLHIWAMSTTDVALSAHLVMPAGHPGDAFILQVGETLKERFRIQHATLQIEMGDAGALCGLSCDHA